MLSYNRSSSLINNNGSCVKQNGDDDGKYHPRQASIADLMALPCLDSAYQSLMKRSQ